MVQSEGMVIMVLTLLARLLVMGELLYNQVAYELTLQGVTE
jgi:hypothetical protein